MHGLLQALIKGIGPIKHQKMVRVRHDHRLKRLHVPTIGLCVDRPEVAADADHRRFDLLKDLGGVAGNVLLHHFLQCAQRHPGRGRGHVGEYPVANPGVGVGPDHAFHKGTGPDLEIVDQRRDHLLQLLAGQGVFNVVKGVDSNQADYPIRHQTGRLGNHLSAHGMADEDDGLAAHRLDHRAHVLAKGLHGVAVAGQARMAVPGEIQNNHPIFLGKMINLGAPVARIAAPAVDKDQGRLTGAVLFIGNGDAVLGHRRLRPDGWGARLGRQGNQRQHHQQAGSEQSGGLHGQRAARFWCNHLGAFFLVKG